MIRDIEGNAIKVGDEVYYARKSSYSANGELVLCTVTKIEHNGNVRLGKYVSTKPENQIIIKVSSREKKLERVLKDA